MYLDHFGLNKPPFKITPDTAMFYSGSQRGAILEALIYAIKSGEGIIKLVSEVGSGKTMMCRMLELKLPKNIEMVYLANPCLSPEHILLAIALELHLPVSKDSDKLEVMQLLQQHLLEKHSKAIQVVVFVEEAQAMPLETLEEIRLLSNLETTEHKLLQIVLFAQPELDAKLAQPSIRQLRERISQNFCLRPFDSKEVHEYLNHRMQVVGYRGPEIFTLKCAQQIYKNTQGLTRRINLLADKALLSAFSENRHQISSKDIKLAIMDNNSYYHNQKSHILSWVGAAILLSIIVLLLLFMPEVNLLRDKLLQAEKIIKINPPGFNKTLLVEVPASVIADKRLEKKPLSSSITTVERDVAKDVKKDEIKTTANSLTAIQSNKIEAQEKQEKEVRSSLDNILLDEKNTATEYPLISQLLRANKQRYAQTNNNFYSVQLVSIASGNKENLERLIDKFSQQLEINQLYLIISTNSKKNKPLYALEYGIFKDIKAAKLAYNDLPEQLKRYQPYIKKKTVSSLNYNKPLSD